MNDVYPIPEGAKFIEIDHNHGWYIIFKDKDNYLLRYAKERRYTDPASLPDSMLGIPHGAIRVCRDVEIDYRKVFAPKNIIKYYWWGLKSYLFSHSSANSTPKTSEMINKTDKKFKYRFYSRIARWLKENTKLNDCPYFNEGNPNKG